MNSTLTTNHGQEVRHDRPATVFRPNVDILETADELILVADLPGVQPGGVDVQFEKGTLTIDAKVASRHGEVAQYLLREYGVGDFQRSFQVGDIIDASAITAEFSEGVLTLRLPKRQAAKARKIEVKTN
jgi:HSP20 family protein